MYFLDPSRNICSSPIPEMYECGLFGTGSLQIHEVKKKLSDSRPGVAGTLLQEYKIHTAGNTVEGGGRGWREVSATEVIPNNPGS